MKTFVLITAIIELVAGALLFLAPQMVPDLSAGDDLVLTLARMYGAAALAVGYYALLVYRNFNPGPAQGFLKTFLVFHIGVSVAAYLGYSSGLAGFLSVTVLHGIMAIFTLYFLFKSRV